MRDTDLGFRVSLDQGKTHLLVARTPYEYGGRIGVHTPFPLHQVQSLTHLLIDQKMEGQITEQLTVDMSHRVGYKPVAYFQVHLKEKLNHQISMG